MWITIPNPDDHTDMPIFEGEADSAHEFLIPGSYVGFDSSADMVEVFVSGSHSSVDWT